MTKLIKLEQPFDLRPYNKTELRKVYGISKYLMSKWLKDVEKELGKRIGYSYSIAQVQIIINKYGIPGQYMEIAA